MFQMISQVSFGAVTGLIAELIKPSRNFGRVFLAASIGLVGSLGGFLVGRALLGTEHNPACWIASILGSLLMLSLYRAIFGTRTAY